MPGTQVRVEGEISSFPVPPSWAGIGRESKDQRPFSLERPPPSFLWCIKGSLGSSPSTHYLEPCSLSAFGGPTAPPSGQNPFRIQKLFRRVRDRAEAEPRWANRLSEMKEQLRQLWQSNGHHISHWKDGVVVSWGEAGLFQDFRSSTVPLLPTTHRRQHIPWTF